MTFFKLSRNIYCNDTTGSGSAAVRVQGWNCFSWRLQDSKSRNWHIELREVLGAQRALDVILISNHVQQRRCSLQMQQPCPGLKGQDTGTRGENQRSWNSEAGHFLCSKSFPLFPVPPLFLVASLSINSGAMWFKGDTEFQALGLRVLHNHSILFVLLFILQSQKIMWIFFLFSIFFKLKSEFHEDNLFKDKQNNRDLSLFPELVYRTIFFI